MGNWKQEAPVGMFWTWGGWDGLSDYDYLTSENMDDLSKINLYENGKKARTHESASVGREWGVVWCWEPYRGSVRVFMFIL